MRRFGMTKLVVSGGAPDGHVPSAFGYRKVAHELGVPDAAIVVLSEPADTHSEAVELARALGRSPFVLVTSAYHMPRAMRLMELADARPIPAPTGQRVVEDMSWSFHRLLPTAEGLRRTEQALHEYLGLIAILAGLY